MKELSLALKGAGVAVPSLSPCDESPGYQQLIQADRQHHRSVSQTEATNDSTPCRCVVLPSQQRKFTSAHMYFSSGVYSQLRDEKTEFQKG